MHRPAMTRRPIPGAPTPTANAGPGRSIQQRILGRLTVQALKQTCQIREGRDLRITAHSAPVWSKLTGTFGARSVRSNTRSGLNSAEISVSSTGQLGPEGG